MFKRKIYDKLLQWKKDSDGKTALLIEGARRIGKSTIVESFGRNEYKSYIIIDFSIVSKNIRELFEDISDLNYLFLQLQLQYKVDLYERESLIIFDEVPLCSSPIVQLLNPFTTILSPFSTGYRFTSGSDKYK